MTNKVSWIFLAKDQYTAVANKVAQATAGMRDKFAGMGASAEKSAADLRKLTDQAKKASENITKVGKSVSLYVSAPAALFAGTSVKAYDEQAQALAQVTAAIKSTGGAAKLSVEELSAEATRLESETIFGDDTILKDVTSRLLRFTNITGDTFKNAQGAALDLATGLGKDLSSSAMMLGKALDNPAEGISALTRALGKVDPVVEEQIKALWAMGKQAEAQSIVLQLVSKRFGGSAAAAAQAGLGPLRQLGNAYNNFQEDVGESLLQIINPFVSGLTSVVRWLNELSPATKSVIGIFVLFLSILGPLIVFLGQLALALPLLTVGASALGVAVNSITWPILAIIAAIALVIIAVIALYKNFDKVEAVIKVVADAITGAFASAVEWVKEAWASIQAIFDKIMEIKRMIEGAITGAVEGVSGFLDFGGSVDLNANSRTDINVNLRAPQGAVESVKSRTTGNQPGMNVGINMEPAR